MSAVSESASLRLNGYLHDCSSWFQPTGVATVTFVMAILLFITSPVTSEKPLPYIFAILFFILVYLLITAPVYSFIALHSASDLYARYTIALLLTAIVFIMVSYTCREHEKDPVPQ